MPTYVETWDETKPLGSRNISLGDDDIREFKRGIRERLATDHDFRSSESGITTIGYHKKVTFAEIQGADPTNAADTAFLYLKDVSAKVELFWMDEDGTVVEMTKGGKLDLDDARISNATWLIGRNAADDGNVNLIQAGRNEADDTDVAVLPDLVRTNTNAAPTEDTQVANKKYVDDSLVGAAVQVVYTQTGAHTRITTAMPFDDTIPQSGEGGEVMTKAITPTNASNLLKIEVVVNGDTESAVRLIAALFQDATGNALAAAVETDSTTGSNAFMRQVVFTHWMVAGTTSETTFKVRMGANSGASNFNGENNSRKFGGVCASSLTITEIKV